MGKRQHSSPTNVPPPSIAVNSPPSPDQSLSSSSVSSTIPTTTVMDNKKEEKSKRSSRRRRKAKPNRGSNNKVESNQTDNCNNIIIDSPSPPSSVSNSSRARANCHNNQNNNNNNSHNKNHHPSPRQLKQQQKTSSFRTPIVSWRNGSNQRRRNNNNNKNNNNHNNHYRHHHHQQQQHSSNSSAPYINNNHNYHHHQQQHNLSSPHHASGAIHYPSPRSLNNNNGASCSASMGFPTSKKQHDAPMKKRDLYFSLHVETIGIAATTAFLEGGNGTGQQRNDNDNNNEQEQKKAAARVTLLNWENEIVLDTYVIIPVPVTDSHGTGIGPGDLRQPITTDANLVDAGVYDSSSCCIQSFTDVRTQIEVTLKGKILIGYKLDEALQGLGLTHPKSDMRDCLSYFSSPSSFVSSSSPPPSLEDISKNVLNESLESVKVVATTTNPETSSITDTIPRDGTMTMCSTAVDRISRHPIQICMTTLDLYKKHRQEWEEALITEARERDQKQQNHLDMITRQRQQEQQQQLIQQQQQQQLYRNSLPTVSLHCDFVRTAISGLTKSLARVVVVDGPTRNVLLDDFVQISVPVTDFCNTGITSMDVKIVNSSDTNNNNDHGQNTNRTVAPNSAKPLQILRLQVERLLRGRILVGYKVEEDLKALGLVYPWTQVRDTAYFPPFLREKVIGASAAPFLRGSIVGGSRVVTVRSLDELSEEFLRRRSAPPGHKSRSTDLCRTVLYLYETFRDQWERHQEETYRLQHHRQQQQQQQGRMISTPSPSCVPVTPHHSPHHQLYHHYRQQQHQHQPVITSQDVPSTMISPPLLPRQQKPQQPPSMPEQQDHGSQSTNSSSSSWFTWVKQYQYSQAQAHPNHLPTASSVLSSQAFQLLQEDPANEQIPSQNHSFLHRDNCSSSSYLDSSMYGEDTVTDDPYEGSMMSADDSHTGCVQKLEPSPFMSVGSSLRSDASSVFSSDQASSIVGSPPPRKNGASSSSSSPSLQNDASSSVSSDQVSSIVESPLSPRKNGASSLSSSSWFRFGSRKSKCSSANEKKKHCESMAAVQELEVLNDDIVMRPIILFSSPEEKADKALSECKPEGINEGEQQEFSLAETPLPSSNQPTIPSRSWLRFRRSSNSPGRKERSRSPPSKLKLDANLEDLSIAARPQVSDDAIEITLSMPSPLENEDSVSPLAEKSSLHSRPSSSWLSFRRSRKSSSSKTITSNTATDILLTKTSDTAYLTKGPVPSLVPSATERTAAMDEDWFQEVMSMSSAGGDTSDMSPWLPETGQRDSKANAEKSSGTSRDQSSWFGFKWSKVSSSNNKASHLGTALDSEDDDGIFDGTAWQNQQQSGASWVPDGASHTLEKEDLNTIIINTNNVHNDINDVFRNRTRISTESTIPSVATEEEPLGEPLEEDVYSDSDEFASGAAQSFNFLKI